MRQSLDGNQRAQQLENEIFAKAKLQIAINQNAK